MIPYCYPSTLNVTTGLRECVVYYLSGVTGLARWSDYIPVKDASDSTIVEGTSNTNGFQAINELVSITGKNAWVDYIPVYDDTAATVPWQVSAVGYIPVGTSGSTTGFLSPSFTVLFEPLTNSTGTVTTLAYINAATGSGTITPSIATNRITGVAPLYVNFDASGTTAASLTSYPFHELQYDWNFGDPTSGSWAYGARAQFGYASSRNTDVGPIAVHVFTEPGDYTVTCTPRYDSTSATPETVTITVTDPLDVFPTTNTVCINPSGDAVFTGAPAGCTQVQTNDLVTEVATQIAAGRKRILLKRGCSWSISAPIVINVDGPGHFGAYGTGARPIITATASITSISVGSYNANNLSDWRVTGIEVDGGDFPASSEGVRIYGSMSEFLVYDVKVGRAKFGIQSLLGNPIYNLPDGMAVVACDIDSCSGVFPTYSGGNGVYIGAQRLALLGTRIRPNFLGEHGCRTYFSNRAVYAHNSISEVVDTKAHLSIRSPLEDAAPLGIFDQVDDGGYVYTEKIVIRDNYVDQSTDTYTAVGVGPVSQDHGAGRVRNVIMEANYGKRVQYGAFGRQVTIRNNICEKRPQNGPLTGVSHLLLQPDPTDVWVYNNSMYTEAAAPYPETNIVYLSGDLMPGVTLTARNNLVYSVDSTQDPDTLFRGVDTGSHTTLEVTQSNNTVTVQTSPNFTTTPPTTPAHFKPTSGYALGGGTSVPVWTDFLGNTVTGATRTIGALEE